MQNRTHCSTEILSAPASEVQFLLMCELYSLNPPIFGFLFYINITDIIVSENSVWVLFT